MMLMMLAFRARMMLMMLAGPARASMMRTPPLNNRALGGETLPEQVVIHFASVGSPLGCLGFSTAALP